MGLDYQIEGCGQKYPNIINASGRRITISSDELDNFLEMEKFDQERFLNTPIHFTSREKRKPNGNYVFGSFEAEPLSDDPSVRRRCVRIHLGSVAAATKSKIDLPPFEYNSSIDINRNASAVLVHELLHLNEDIEAINTVIKSFKRFHGLGRFGLLQVLDRDLRKTKPYLNGDVGEGKIKEKVANLFSSSAFDNLVRVSYFE